MPYGRGRIVSLSYDWDKVISKQVEDRKKNDLPENEHPGYVIIHRFPQKFCTNTCYSGQWNAIGMSGIGSFDFPHGIEYEGKLRDGMFHGEGTLAYPMGQTFEGVWDKGKMTKYTFEFSDHLKYENPWKYCQMPDRRYFTCIQEGLRPAGQSLITNKDPPRRIPEGCYDTGDGYYNPRTKCVMSAINPGKIIRIPKKCEEAWIIEHCRKAWDESTGFKPNLYEHWVSGRVTDSILLDSETTITSISSQDCDTVDM